jgi:hypothetical protein
LPCGLLEGCGCVTGDFCVLFDLYFTCPGAYYKQLPGGLLMEVL